MWCHSKLDPHSTSSPAGEGENPPHSLTPGGESVSRGLGSEGSGKVATPKARQAWPCLGITSRDRRMSEAPARSAPQARDPLAKQWRGFQPPLDQDPWNALIVLGAKNRASERVAIRSLSSLRKMPGGFWRQMGSDPPLSGATSIITRDRIVQRTDHASQA